MLTPRRPALVALLVLVAVLVVPGVAEAEGPGYDGRANSLLVRETRGKPQAAAMELQVPYEVFGRGFRGGSEVTLQVGDAGETTAVADSTGVLSANVDARPGTTIAAVGQSPSGSALTLLGSAPSTGPDGNPFALAGLGLWLFGAFGLISLLRLGYWGRGRPAFYRAVHGSNR